jgi:hypothetical protein
VVVRIIAAIAVLAACGNDHAPPGAIGPLDEFTAQARQTYPTIAALYEGDQGIYRGCAPNGGVCHNSNEYPVLGSLGGVLATVGAGCNFKRAPRDFDDLCEPRGDTITIGSRDVEIGWAVRDPDNVRWRMNVRSPVDPRAGEALPIRGGVWHLGTYASVALDPDDPAQRTLLLEPYDDRLDILLGAAGTSADQIQLGDPNRNGRYGAELGGKLVKPGAPSASYLMRRLVDPDTGPLMPRANCCFWTKTAVRALWCWIDRLDAEHPMAPIDYDTCRPSPNVELLYPELGAGCETSGRCPVEAVVDDTGTDFASIYRGIFVPRCSGQGCHDREHAGNLDLGDEDRAFTSLASRVIPGDAAGSLLVKRLDPSVCNDACQTMPLGRTPLSSVMRARIAEWITDGAAR